MPNENSDRPNCPTHYQQVAEIVYAEHPEMKDELNNGAQLAIDTLNDSMPSDQTDQDLESVLSLIAFIAGDLLNTNAHDLSAKLNLLFDTYSLAAGAVAGEVDLGDTSKAKDMATVIREAREHAQAHVSKTDTEQTGQYL